MSNTSLPTPFDPPDLPVAFGTLNGSSRLSLALLWSGSSASYLTQLQALDAVEQVAGAWKLNVRGLQLAAWGRAKGLL